MATKLIELEYDNLTYTADLKVLGSGLLSSAGGFESAVTISLYTWKRLDSADLQLVGNKYGWWGDTFSEDPEDEIGSLLWTLRREKNSPETQQRVISVCEDALEWMVTDGIAESIEVTVERFALQVIAVRIAITRSVGGAWSGIWEVHLDAL